ncbi:MAG: alkane 1-monooxygenase [Cyclobacteriaceae bacterium]
MSSLRFLKYLTVYTLPASVYIAFNTQWVFFPLVLYFVFVPGLELLFKPQHNNLSEEEKEAALHSKVYDVLLYIMLPIQFGFLWYFLTIVSSQALTWVQWAGLTSAMGLMSGVIGINVGHELGHRKERFDRFVGELLLLSSLNTHFLPYHNLGHHKNVATPSDPATARRGEWLFVFWFRSNFSSYIEAWHIESERLTKRGLNPFSVKNRMIVYSIAQFGLLALVYFFFGLTGVLAFLGASIFGILLLETVNYIEHYGLLRLKNDKGHYERVKPWHSWNSDHMIGRVILFELSRHSDHHYLASKKYQILDSFEDSPQMPTGYPGMLILSLIPPIWFRVMNPKVDKIRAEHSGD